MIVVSILLFNNKKVVAKGIRFNKRDYPCNLCMLTHISILAAGCAVNSGTVDSDLGLPRYAEH